MQPPMPYPQQPPPRKSSGANIIVILAVIFGGLLVFGGIFAVLAISGVRKYVQNAKMVEATNSVGTIGRFAVMTYQAESPQTLCASASKPVPESVGMVSGKKYVSTTTEWERDTSANAGFACLHFAMTSPQYYQYDYQTTGTASRQAVGDGFRAIAKGDLDGDGELSTFTQSGRIGAAGSLDLDPSITQTNPTE